LLLITEPHNGVAWRLEILLWYRAVSRLCVLSKYKMGTEGEEMNHAQTLAEKSISITPYSAWDAMRGVTP